MGVILQFEQVAHEKLGTLSFSLSAAEMKVLQLPGKDAKAALADLVLGDQLPEQGTVLLHGKRPEDSAPGRAGIIQANGGLVSNLKVWENITLPGWYHGLRQKRSTEQTVAKWLGVLLPDEQEWERFMGSPVARLRTSERKLAGILRMLVWAPELLLLDAALFDEVEDAKCALWVSALEQYINEDRARGMLAICHLPARLPWKVIE